MDELVIHPFTGEVLDLDSPTEHLARWLQEQRDQEQVLREEKNRVQRELLRRMDLEANYTLRAGEFEIKGDGPQTPLEYDGQGLREALDDYVKAGFISRSAVDRAVEPVTAYKVKAAGVNALRKLEGSTIPAVIDRYAAPKEGYVRRVSVKAR